MNKILLVALLLLFGAAPGVFAQTLPAPSIGADVQPAAVSPATQAVTVKLIADTTAIEPGKPFRIGAEISLQPGWHVYYREPGDSGMPTKVDIKLPEGFTVVKVEWEKPTRFEAEGLVTYGYTDKP